MKTSIWKQLIVWTATAVGVMVVFDLVHYIGVAHAAAAAAATADPVATAGVATDALVDAVVTYGPLWGGVIVLYSLASSVLKRNNSTHWVAQGRTLAVIAAVIMVGGAALQAKLGGAPWSGVLMTAILAVVKLVDPHTVKPAVAPASSPMNPSIVAALLISGAALGATQISCAEVKPRVVAATSAFLDCETAHLDATLLADATSIAKVALLAAIGGDGKVDLATLKADAKPIVTDLGRCALAAAIAAISTPAPAQPGAPAAAGLVVDGSALRGAFTSARAELGWPAIGVSGQVL